MMGILLHKSITKGVTIWIIVYCSTHQKFKYKQLYLGFKPLWACIYSVIISWLSSPNFYNWAIYYLSSMSQI